MKEQFAIRWIPIEACIEYAKPSTGINLDPDEIVNDKTGERGKGLLIIILSRPKKDSSSYCKQQEVTVYRS